MTKPTLHLIAGPTASGKSALALEIARRERGTIINADAMQVYAGLPILTAQPSLEDRAEIPHELYEVFDPTERSSAGIWLVLAQEAIDRTVKAERTPIVVGGTGLYFKALLEGLAEIPSIPKDLRDAAQKLYTELGPDAFRAELAKLDPASAEHIKPNDKQRLIRAYEVALHTGKPIGYWQSGIKNPVSGQERENSSPCHSLVSDREVRRGGDRPGEDFALQKPTAQPLFSPPSLTLPARGREFTRSFSLTPHLFLPPRDELYASCDKRFLQMMERGAIEEVRALLTRRLDPDLPAMKILGVREIAAYLQNKATREEAIAKARQATRNYAKRQMTWFRNQWKQP